MGVHSVPAVAPGSVPGVARAGIPQLGLGYDAYVCGRCAHVVATGGDGLPDPAAQVWIQCVGCGWAVAVPSPALPLDDLAPQPPAPAAQPADAAD
ncbi:hypothetical protein [Baekduia soli]|uniref:hypothetical protein n=1 Tax=Baekduia soli TaxID=496014 RepID=UPI001652ADD7|nr:hypothetical protein [Baekduia soli]